VKWFINNIYRKLNVRSRVQAIVRARELNLIVEEDRELEAPSITTSRLPEPENPYKGLRAFQPADEQDFFGREKLTSKLLSRMEKDSDRFMAVVGPSGSGKSSLVKAGLIPALWRGELPGSEKWYIVDMMPGTHPLDELEIALLGVAATQVEGLGEQLKRDARGLLRASRLILPEGDSELLVVIDQFEEVFTLVEDEQARTHFLDLLSTAVRDPRSRVRVVVTLRADFYDRPLQYPQFGDLVRSRMETVLPLSAEEMERAITLPAEQVGVYFEEGLVATIIDEVHYQPGALPLLQYALTELFELRENRTLTQEAYQLLGRTAGAVANRAEEVYLGLGEGGHEVVRQMFLRLVTLGEGVEGTRRRVERSELLAVAGDPDLMDEVIDTYANYRLLSLDNNPSTRAPVVEVAHEAILREWERLREWLEEARDDIRLQRQLARAAKEWEDADRDASFLLRGSRLQQFELWVNETGLALTAKEIDYLDKCIAEREQEEEEEARRQAREASLERRRFILARALVVVLGVAFVIAAVLSALKLASIGLAGQALNEMHGIMPQRAVPLAVEALEDYPYTWQAQRSLSTAVLNHKLKSIISHPDRVTTFDLSENGERLLTGCDDGTIRIWDLTQGEELLSLSVGGSSVFPSWSPDETLIHSLSVRVEETQEAEEDVVYYSLQIWDSTSGELRFSQDLDSDFWLTRFNWLPWSPDGTRFVTAHEDGTARIWDAISGDVLHILSGHEGAVSEAAWSPAGDTIVTTGALGDAATAILWDAATGEALFTFPGTDWGIRFGSWSSTGDRLALRGFGRISVYDIASGEELVTLSTPGVWNQHALFSPDDSLIIAPGDDTNARLWDAETGELMSMLPGLQIGNRVAWSPDGDYAAVGTNLSTVLIWDVNLGEVIDTIQYNDAPGFIDWSPSGDTVLVGSWYQSNVRMYQLSSAMLSIPGPPGTAVGALGWSPDSQQIARGFPDGSVKVWLASTGEERFTLMGSSEEIDTSEAYWSPSGDRILTIQYCDMCDVDEDEFDTIIWDATNGERLLGLSSHEGSIFSGGWSPDGSQIVTTGMDDKKVIVSDSATGRTIKTLSFDDSALLAVWSPDGSRMVTTNFSGQAAIWGTATWELEQDLFPEDYSEIVYGVAWTKDGERLAVWSLGNMHIFDTTTGEELKAFPGKGGFSVQWSPTEEYIFVFGWDGVGMYDVETGAELMTYDLGTWVEGRISPDGRLMALTRGSGYTYIYPVWQTPEELIAYAKECCMIHVLTEEERELFGLPQKED
jgi:WD40 repeat protein